MAGTLSVCDWPMRPITVKHREKIYTLKKGKEKKRKKERKKRRKQSK